MVHHRAPFAPLRPAHPILLARNTTSPRAGLSDVPFIRTQRPGQHASVSWDDFFAPSEISAIDPLGSVPSLSMAMPFFWARVLTLVRPIGCTESAGIVLLRSDPRDVVGAIELSRATYRNGDYDGRACGH